MTKTDNLTMPTEILNTNARNVLQTFANKLWDTMVSHDVKVVDIKNIYDKSVNDLLGDNSIKQKTKQKAKQKTKQQKPKIPIPFYGYIEKDWCCGVKKNHGLYTQCTKPKPKDCQYCKICSRQAMNNANGKPNCGDIIERAEQWNEKLDYKPPGMKKEIPYANVMKKLNISNNDAQEVVENLGWGPIPECHLIEKKARRGRPKTKIVVEDSDDEMPKKKRGRPRKEIQNEPTDEELIAQFMESCL